MNPKMSVSGYCPNQLLIETNNPPAFLIYCGLLSLQACVRVLERNFLNSIDSLRGMVCALSLVASLACPTGRDHRRPLIHREDHIWHLSSISPSWKTLLQGQHLDQGALLAEIANQLWINVKKKKVAIYGDFLKCRVIHHDHFLIN